jgi:hypothetical protein
LKVQGVKLRVFEDHGGISKQMVVQGGLVKLFQKKKKRKEGRNPRYRVDHATEALGWVSLADHRDPRPIDTPPSYATHPCRPNPSVGLA